MIHWQTVNILDVSDNLVIKRLAYPVWHISSSMAHIFQYGTYLPYLSSRYDSTNYKKLRKYYLHRSRRRVVMRMQDLDKMILCLTVTHSSIFNTLRQALFIKSAHEAFFASFTNIYPQLSLATFYLVLLH